MALKIFSARSYLINEYARTAYKKGVVLKLMGQHGAASKRFEEAYQIFKRLRPQDHRTAEDLTERDFDQLVGFWSR
ncbi:uncharacterized protein C8A04DRAFT_29132 [Dichotomopilus funicola]|uniref:Tetratricopeptide repeat protein n=1 Tax=Dichotomopilus funicola TaxID=1934379 RepID=A0AAN6V3Z2_9PEZI|nr:hypothetical protein C8A04DRAFT_29132 [Dichotomopilus funicola]